MTMQLEDALVSGLPVGAGQLAHCDCCNACLRPNHRAEVLIVIDGANIQPVVTRCLACAREEIHDQTARPCLLARGRLAGSVAGNGRSQLILSGAEVIDRTE